GGATLTETGVDILKEYQMLQKRLRKAAARPVLSQAEADLFKRKVVLPDLTIIGSNSVGIDLIIEQMLEEMEFSYEVVNVGSSGGLNAIMLGEADIAGVHLNDPETGEYNKPFLQRYWISGKTILVRGFRRMQGFIVKKRNPKRILGFRDLLRRDVKLVNRGLGSGTRHLLDLNIQRIAEEDKLDVKSIVKKVRGYDFEVGSHPEVAEAVESGEADVGLGVEVRAVRMGLDFVPIQEEWFDFAVDVSRVKKPVVELFLRTLRSERLRESAKMRAPELKFTDETGSIIYQP
ncbi:MAG: substrate-binding domain-containing protein, partial [Nitrososphaerales archaeon]